MRKEEQYPLNVLRKSQFLQQLIQMIQALAHQPPRQQDDPYESQKAIIIVGDAERMVNRRAPKAYVVRWNVHAQEETADEVDEEQTGPEKQYLPVVAR